MFSRLLLLLLLAAAYVVGDTPVVYVLESPLQLYTWSGARDGVAGHVDFFFQTRDAWYAHVTRLQESVDCGDTFLTSDGEVFAIATGWNSRATLLRVPESFASSPDFAARGRFVEFPFPHLSPFVKNIPYILARADDSRLLEQMWAETDESEGNSAYLAIMQRKRGVAS
jgi:hypothetical protein